MESGNSDTQYSNRPIRRVGQIQNYCVTQNESIRLALQRIDEGQLGVCFVVDDNQCFRATVTDGDIRRYLLDCVNLNGSLERLLEHKKSHSKVRPLTAREGTSQQELRRVLTENGIRHLPIIDHSNRLVDLATLDTLLSPGEKAPLKAVVMAGGYGTRLLPLTENTPKPMLPVGGKPLMERIINQLHDAGVRHVDVATHYKSEKIEEYFGDGKEFGLSINYLKEEKPLGTGGALSLLEHDDKPLLVLNGDILTQVDIQAMLDCHRDHSADFTVGVRRYDMQVPYGVVRCENSRVVGLDEKPELNYLVNAGIYMIEPRVLKILRHGEACKMTDLVERSIAANLNIVSFLVREYWLDIGQHDDYRRAQENYDDEPS